jgi:hypothetical protein
MFLFLYDYLNLDSYFQSILNLFQKIDTDIDWNEFSDPSGLLTQDEIIPETDQRLPSVDHEQVMIDRENEQLRKLYLDSVDEYNKLASEHSDLKFKYYRLYYGYPPDAQIYWQQIAFDKCFEK